MMDNPLARVLSGMKLPTQELQKVEDRLLFGTGRIHHGVDGPIQNTRRVSRRKKTFLDQSSEKGRSD
jgi:hypothetical protein